MTNEKNELVIILSQERNRLTRERECDFCGMDLEAGKKTLSLGVIDRMHETRERWYICPWCEEWVSYANAEDAPEHVQQFMFAKRLTQEIWVK